MQTIQTLQDAPTVAEFCDEMGLQYDPTDTSSTGVISTKDEVQDIRPTGYQLPGAVLNGQKVKKTGRFSELARWILKNAGDGIDRGQIIEGKWKLERRYIGFYTDPCLPPKAHRDYERLYRKKQPLVSYTLRRLEKLGYVRLMRQRRYIKAVRLTDKGKAIAEKLNSKKSNTRSGK